MGSLVGLDDVVLGFGFQGFEVTEITVEFAVVAADQLFAFSLLRSTISL